MTVRTSFAAITTARSLLLIACVPLAFILTDIITIVRIEACPDENLPALIGLPFVYRTSVPWVNSMSGVLYAKGLLLNALTLVISFAFMALGLRKFLPEWWLKSRGRVALEWGLIVTCILVIALCLFAVEWDLLWAPEFNFRCPERTLQIMSTFL